MKSIICTADDFGLCSSIDEGIIEASSKGIVSHVSVIVNGSHFEKAAAFINQNPWLSAGIHLNLTDGKPASRKNAYLKPLLNSRFEFCGSHLLPLLKLLPPWNTRNFQNAIELEWRMQIEALVQKKITIQQIASHGHVHLFPPLHAIVKKLAAQYEIPFIRSIQEPVAVKQFINLPVNAVKTKVLSFFSSLQARSDHTKYVQAKGVLFSGMLNERNFYSLLEDLKEDLTEIITHPGAASEKLSEKYQWGYHWQAEKHLLTSVITREALAKKNIRLTNFQEFLN